jgi:hypothetical protein
LRSTLSLPAASNFNRDYRSSTRVAAHSIDPRCLHRLDGYSRGGFPRATRFLPAAIETGSLLASPQILLLIHVRILLQPLRGVAVPGHHAVQTSLSRVEGIFHCPLRAGLGANQYMSIYNHLRLDIKHEQVEIRAKEKEEDAVPRPKAA